MPVAGEDLVVDEVQAEEGADAEEAGDDDSRHRRDPPEVLAGLDDRPLRNGAADADNQHPADHAGAGEDDFLHVLVFYKLDSRREHNW